MTLAGLTIDAGVLAIPQESSGREEIFQYVNALLKWHEMLFLPWLAVCISYRCSQVLESNGVLPNNTDMRELFRLNGVSEFDANTVVTVIYGLMGRARAFEEHFGASDILIENYSWEPPLVEPGVSNPLRSELAERVFLVAVLKSYCAGIIANQAIAVRSAPSAVVRLSANILAIDKCRDDCTFPFQNGEDYFQFEGNVSICDDPHGLIASIDEKAILAAANENYAIELAVQIALFRERRKRGVDAQWTENRNFCIGRRFLATMKKYGKTAAPSLQKKIFRAIVEAIDDLNLSATHAIRTSTGGGSAQRERTNDNAQAWRRNIDRNYRLHYWKKPDGVVELASIGPHDQFSIPG